MFRRISTGRTRAASASAFFRRFSAATQSLHVAPPSWSRRDHAFFLNPALGFSAPHAAHAHTSFALAVFAAAIAAACRLRFFDAAAVRHRWR